LTFFFNSILVFCVLFDISIDSVGYKFTHIWRHDIEEQTQKKITKQPTYGSGLRTFFLLLRRHTCKDGFVVGPVTIDK
jgi:hypothetical protein